MISLSVRAFGAMALVPTLLGMADATSAATHKLVVAVHPSLDLDQNEVDEVIDGMNKVIRQSKYGNPWDSPCADLKFVRDGKLISDDRLPTEGNYDDLVSSLKAVAPKANVLVVLGINCAGVPGAAGCGFVGGEPLVVGIYPGFNDQLWLHERGHNVGLQHSAEGPKADSSFPLNVGKRFMFWQLGIGHVGKLATECNVFKNSQLPSVVPSGGAPAVVTLAAVSADVPPSSAAVASAAVAEVENELTAAAKAVGLTPEAYRVMGPPWLHGLPYEALMQLKPVDLTSIRTMLNGPVNQYWPQAITTLAAVGSEGDVALINKALNLPLPAAAPSANSATKNQFRNLLRTKLAAPIALGILANRTKSVQATSILQSSANVSKAAELIGAQNAVALSKQALQGLSLANNAQSKEFLKAVAAESTPLPASSLSAAMKVAPLSPVELERLRKNANVVSTLGIENYLKASVKSE